VPLPGAIESPQPTTARRTSRVASNLDRDAAAAAAAAAAPAAGGSATDDIEALNALAQQEADAKKRRREQRRAERAAGGGDGLASSAPTQASNIVEGAAEAAAAGPTVLQDADAEARPGHVFGPDGTEVPVPEGMDPAEFLIILEQQHWAELEQQQWAEEQAAAEGHEGQWGIEGQFVEGVHYFPDGAGNYVDAYGNPIAAEQIHAYLQATTMVGEMEAGAEAFGVAQGEELNPDGTVKKKKKKGKKGKKGKKAKMKHAQSTYDIDQFGSPEDVGKMSPYDVASALLRNPYYPGVPQPLSCCNQYYRYINAESLEFSYYDGVKGKLLKSGKEPKRWQADQAYMPPLAMITIEGALTSPLSLRAAALHPLVHEKLVAQLDAEELKRAAEEAERKNKAAAAAAAAATTTTAASPATDTTAADPATDATAAPVSDAAAAPATDTAAAPAADAAAAPATDATAAPATDAAAAPATDAAAAPASDAAATAPATDAAAAPAADAAAAPATDATTASASDAAAPPAADAAVSPATDAAAAPAADAAAAPATDAAAAPAADAAAAPATDAAAAPATDAAAAPATDAAAPPAAEEAALVTGVEMAPVDGADAAAAPAESHPEAPAEAAVEGQEEYKDYDPSQHTTWYVYRDIETMMQYFYEVSTGYTRWSPPSTIRDQIVEVAGAWVQWDSRFDDLDFYVRWNIARLNRGEWLSTLNAAARTGCLASARNFEVWQSMNEGAEGVLFYFNKATGASAWEPPVEIGSIPPEEWKAGPGLAANIVSIVSVSGADGTVTSPGSGQPAADGTEVCTVRVKKKRIMRRQTSGKVDQTPDSHYAESKGVTQIFNVFVNTGGNSADGVAAKADGALAGADAASLAAGAVGPGVSGGPHSAIYQAEAIDDTQLRHADRTLKPIRGVRPKREGDEPSLTQASAAQEGDILAEYEDIEVEEEEDIEVAIRSPPPMPKTPARGLLLSPESTRARELESLLQEMETYDPVSKQLGAAPTGNQAPPEPPAPVTASASLLAGLAASLPQGPKPPPPTSFKKSGAYVLVHAPKLAVHQRWEQEGPWMDEHAYRDNDTSDRAALSHLGSVVGLIDLDLKMALDRQARATGSEPSLTFWARSHAAKLYGQLQALEFEIANNVAAATGASAAEVTFDPVNRSDRASREFCRLKTQIVHMDGWFSKEKTRLLSMGVRPGSAASTASGVSMATSVHSHATGIDAVGLDDSDTDSVVEDAMEAAMRQAAAGRRRSLASETTPHAHSNTGSRRPSGIVSDDISKQLDDLMKNDGMTMRRSSFAGGLVASNAIGPVTTAPISSPAPGGLGLGIGIGIGTGFDHARHGANDPPAAAHGPGGMGLGLGLFAHGSRPPVASFSPPPNMGAMGSPGGKSYFSPGGPNLPPRAASGNYGGMVHPMGFPASIDNRQTNMVRSESMAGSEDMTSPAQRINSYQRPLQPPVGGNLPRTSSLSMGMGVAPVAMSPGDDWSPERKTYRLGGSALANAAMMSMDRSPVAVRHTPVGPTKTQQEMDATLAQLTGGEGLGGMSFSSPATLTSLGSFSVNPGASQGNSMGGPSPGNMNSFKSPPGRRAPPSI
jgi:hypothetical protein